MHGQQGFFARVAAGLGAPRRGEYIELSGARILRSIVAVIAIAGSLVAVAPQLTESAFAADTRGTVVEYPLPTTLGRPQHVALGPDGNVWFTEYEGNKIAKITPAGVVTEYPVPTAGSHPVGITLGADGKLWFTEYSTGKVGQAATDGTIVEYALPLNTHPGDITAGPDGNLWIVGAASYVIKVTTSGVVTTVPVPASSWPSEIAPGSDNASVWVAESDPFNGQKMARIATADGAVTEFPFLEASTASDVTLGPDGNVWYTLPNANKIGKVTPSGTVTEYSPPGTPTYQIFEIAPGPDGDIWFAATSIGSQDKGRIGRITTSGQFLPSVAMPNTSHPLLRDLTKGSDDNMWASEPSQGSEPSMIAKVGTADPPLGASGEFVPITPTRILDTRTGLGIGGTPAKVGPGQSIALQITGANSIPASGVSAVVINVTATGTVTPSSDWVTVYPDDGGATPLAANLNFSPGETRPNLVTVKVATNGEIRLANGQGSIDLVGDVMGYYSDNSGTPGSRFHGAPPTRRIDTRSGTGGNAIGPNQALTLNVCGVGGLPASGVTAVAMNVTVVGPSASFGWVTAYPADVSTPATANLNYTAGETVPNFVIVRVPDLGPQTCKIKIENGPYGATHIVADVVGWYDQDRSTEAGRFVALSPVRQFDTRFDDAPVGPNEGVLLSFDDTIDAVVLNTAITAPTAAGWLTVYPYNNDAPPLAANLNWTPGITVANFVQVKVGGSSQGYSVLFANGPNGYVDIIADLNGYFASDPLGYVAAQTANEEAVPPSTNTTRIHVKP